MSMKALIYGMVTAVAVLCVSFHVASGAVNETLHVDAKPEDGGVIEGTFDDPPNANKDEIIIDNPDSAVFDDCGHAKDVIDDLAWLCPAKESGPVTVDVEGRQGVGSKYWVTVYVPGTKPGPPGGKRKLLWADVADKLTADLTLIDMNSLRAVGDWANGGPPPPQTLICKTAADGRGDVHFYVANLQGECPWTITGGTERSGTFSDANGWVAFETDLNGGEHVLTVTGQGDIERKIKFIVANLTITKKPDNILTAATAWVPITIKILGMGSGSSGPEIRNPVVRLYILSEVMHYTVTKYGKDDGMEPASEDHDSGESDTYTLWVPMTAFRFAIDSGKVYYFPYAEIKVECEIATHGTTNWSKTQIRFGDEAGYLESLVGRGIPAVEIGVDRKGAAGLRVNYNEGSDQTSWHTGAQDADPLSPCRLGDPAALQPPINQRPLPHKCATTAAVPGSDRKCFGPEQSGNDYRWFSDVEFGEELLVQGLSLSASLTSEVVVPADDEYFTGWNEVKLRNYGASVGLYFGCSYGVKEVLMLTGEKGMDLDNTESSAVVSLFPEGKFEWDNTKSGPQGAGGTIGTGESLAATFGVIATIGYAAGATPVAVVASLVWATAVVVDKLIGADEAAQDSGWKHEATLYRIWAYRPNKSNTVYDSVYNNSITKTTGSGQCGATMTRDNVPMKVASFYFLRANVSVSAVGRTTKDDTTFTAAGKFSNGDSLFTKVDVDF